MKFNFMKNCHGDDEIIPFDLSMRLGFSEHTHLNKINIKDGK